MVTEIEKRKRVLCEGYSCSSGSFQYEKHRERNSLVVEYDFDKSKGFEVVSLEEAVIIQEKIWALKDNFDKNKALELARQSFEKALGTLIKKYMRGGRIASHSEMKAVAITVKRTSQIYFHYLWDHFASSPWKKKEKYTLNLEKDLLDYFMMLKKELEELLEPVCEILMTETFTAADKRYLLRPYYPEFWWPNKFTEGFTDYRINKVISGLLTGISSIKETFTKYQNVLAELGEEFIPEKSALIDPKIEAKQQEQQRLLDVIKKYDDGIGTTYDQIAAEINLTEGELDDAIFRALYDSKIFEPQPGHYKLIEDE